MRKNILTYIIILAAVLRFFVLDKVPPHLNWDETAMGYAAYSILETGMDEWGEKLPIFFRSYGEWKSPVYIYLLVPFIKLFGLTEWAVRIPSALAGVGVVYLIYLLGKLLYSKKAGLWAAFFVSVSPFHLMLSRPAFEANTSLFLVLWGIYNLALASRKNWKNYLYAGLGFGLAPHTYNSAKIVVPFLVLWLLYRLRSKLNKKYVVGMLIGLMLFALPIVSSILSGKAQYRYNQVGITTDLTLITQFYQYRQTFPAPEVLNKMIFNKYTFFVYKFSDNWLSYFSPNFLLTEGGDHNQHSIPYRGILYFTEFAFIIFGLSHLKKKSKNTLKYLPLIIIALGFIPPATTRESHHVLRSILTIPGWSLLAGLGAVELGKLRARHPKMLTTIYIILATEVLTFIFMYFSWYPRAFARDWQYGYKQVVAYAREHEDEYDRIVVSKWYGEPQVFFAFYNAWDPAWYQEQNAKNLRYESEGKIWLDQLDEYSIGKYVFKYIEWPKDRDPNTLYIGKFDDFYEDSNYLKTIYFPDGTVAFHIVKGDK